MSFPVKRPQKYPRNLQIRVKKEFIWRLREVLWNAPKSMWKIYFSRDGLCNFFRNAPFHFRFIFPFKIDHVHFFRNAPLFYVHFFKCPIFPIWFWKWEKWGISKFSNIRKRGISKFSHVINFKTQKEPKMKFIDFWAFQNFVQLLSHDKIIFHMLFGAFHIAPRNHFLWKPA